MALDIEPATDEQIDQFLKAAADRYAQLGISPEKAAELFQAYMAKAGAALGFKLPTMDCGKPEKAESKK